MNANYIIKHVDNEEMLLQLMYFIRCILGRDKEICDDYTYEAWQKRLKEIPELLLYAEADGEIVGVVFGRINNSSITLGPVATRSDYRHCGISRALITEIEKRAKDKGFNHLGLGAREEAEGFYLKCGFSPFLFIQDKKPRTLDELRMLNTKYTEVWCYENETDIRLMLQTPEIDKELQHKYDRTFPGCSTQTVFSKNL